MKIIARAIVSNSDMTKNYKACREKAESFGKIFVLKNNQPEAVLFSVTEYEKISAIIEYIENFEENEVKELVETLPKIKKDELLEIITKTYTPAK